LNLTAVIAQDATETPTPAPSPTPDEEMRGLEREKAEATLRKEGAK
jgi:hypothetical protein